jgi:CheY-like chemotaxis protein
MAMPTVLLVDDYKPFLQVLQSILPADRFHVLAHASDGIEAIKKAELLRPNLILLDIGLPRLSGIEVARTVKSFAPQTTILMLSQDASPDVIEEALKTGALGYVHKQRAQRELLIAIECVLAGKRFVSNGLLDRIGVSASAQALHSHRVLYYSDEPELLDGLARFLADAMRINSPVISIVSQSHRDGLTLRLRESGIDVEGAMSQGWCLWFDADDPLDEAEFTAVVQRVVNATTKIAVSLPPRVALCGELAGRLCAEGKIDEALALELFGDRLAHRFDLDVLCAYPISQSQSLQAQRASLIHSIVHAA